MLASVVVVGVVLFEMSCTLSTKPVKSLPLPTPMSAMVWLPLVAIEKALVW